MEARKTTATEVSMVRKKIENSIFVLINKKQVKTADALIFAIEEILNELTQTELNSLIKLNDLKLRDLLNLKLSILTEIQRTLSLKRLDEFSKITNCDDFTKSYTAYETLKLNRRYYEDFLRILSHYNYNLSSLEIYENNKCTKPHILDNRFYSNYFLTRILNFVYLHLCLEVLP